jgi:hypothetical protein
LNGLASRALVYRMKYDILYNTNAHHHAVHSLLAVVDQFPQQRVGICVQLTVRGVCPGGQAARASRLAMIWSASYSSDMPRVVLVCGQGAKIGALVTDAELELHSLLILRSLTLPHFGRLRLPEMAKKEPIAHRGGRTPSLQIGLLKLAL